MIETAMLVALGFFAATLLAVLVLPLVSRRATRLAAVRLQEVIPLSVDEIAADRDGLRASAAIEQRRIEQKLERVAALSAAGDVELGRRTAEAADLARARDAEREANTVLAADLDRTRQALADTETRRADLERTCADQTVALGEAEQKQKLMEGRYDEAQSQAEERRGMIASLETRYAGLDMRRSDLEEEGVRVRAEHDQTRAMLLDMTRERDLSRREVQLGAAQRDMLQDDLAALTRRTEGDRLALQAKTEALRKAEQTVMEETVDRKAAETALSDLRRRFEALETRLIEAGGSAAETLVEADLDALRASVTSVADDALRVLGPRGTRPRGSVDREG